MPMKRTGMRKRLAIASRIPPFAVPSSLVTAIPVTPSERLGHPVPADLEAIVLRCLAKPAGERYASAAELERALAACAVANDWSAERAQGWWHRHGTATPVRELAGAGRTVEIDPSTRQAALPNAPTVPMVLRRE